MSYPLLYIVIASLVGVSCGIIAVAVLYRIRERVTNDSCPFALAAAIGIGAAVTLSLLTDIGVFGVIIVGILFSVSAGCFIKR